MKGKKKSSLPSKDADELLMAVGQNLKKWRKARGYKNGDDFAYDSGINRSQYGKYEAGSQDMRVTTLIKIVRSLNVPLPDFFSGDFGSK
jgi:transcriptional regulator with XRE-family HTH domain